jgi:hypothetical protein
MRRQILCTSLALISGMGAANALDRNDLAALQETVRSICAHPDQKEKYISVKGDLDVGAILKVSGVNAEGKITKDEWNGINQRVDQYKTDPRQCVITILPTLISAISSSPHPHILPLPDDGPGGPVTANIIDTRSAPLERPGEEASSYGLYTYVLLRGSANRDKHFLKDIVESAPSASGVLAPLRAHIDLMLIPANPCPIRLAKSPADCQIHLVDNVERDPKANYNYGESNTLLEELCAKPPDKLADFCRDPIGWGPFLFTYARPVSTMNPIPPPFLFFDFTEHDEAAFPDFIGAYEAVLKSDDFTDDSKLNTLRLRILDVYNRARAATGPTAEGAAKLVHLFYAGGKD